MLEKSNFGHMNIELESRDKIFQMKSWVKVMISLSFFKNVFVFRGSGAADFADIIKIAIILIKTNFKDSIKVKILYQNAFFFLYFTLKQNWLISSEKCLCQQNSRCVSRDLYIFWISFRKGITVPSLIIAEYV